MQGEENMRVRYDKDEDILMIELMKKKVDDAFETENMIVHVDKNKEPVLLEIFNARKFLNDINKTLPPKVKNDIFISSSF